jgi:hypothetical protein
MLGRVIQYPITSLLYPRTGPNLALHCLYTSTSHNSKRANHERHVDEMGGRIPQHLSSIHRKIANQEIAEIECT